LSNCQDLLSWYFSTLSIIIHAICLILREKIIIMWRNDLKMIMTNPVSKKKISLFFGGAKNILIRLNFKWIGCMLHGLKKKRELINYIINIVHFRNLLNRFFKEIRAPNYNCRLRVLSHNSIINNFGKT